MPTSALVERSMTVEDFLTFLEDRPKGERWELGDEGPVINPHPTRRHDWIQLNVLLALRAHWQRHGPGWRPAGPSQVPVPGRNRTVAPDVLVAPEGGPDDTYLTPDPIVVFEVLSRSDTKARRMRKLADCEAVPSIRHYVVVRQDRREVTAHSRDAEGRFVADPPGPAIDIATIGVTLTLDAIYEATPLSG